MNNYKIGITIYLLIFTYFPYFSLFLFFVVLQAPTITLVFLIEEGVIIFVFHMVVTNENVVVPLGTKKEIIQKQIVSSMILTLSFPSYRWPEGLI